MTGILAVAAAIGSKTFSGAAGVPVAFFVGMISFFSPCILPLVPGYLSYMSGVSGDELASGERRGRVLIATLLFVLGFALVFTALGAGLSAIGGYLFDHLDGINRIAGVVVILMGLLFLSSLAIRPLQRLAHEGSPAVRGASRVLLKGIGFFMQERGALAPSRAGLVGALPLGAAFGVGWVPCVGPGYGAILTIAGTEGDVGRGALLLFAFSLGFGVWFVLGGLGFDRAMRAFGVMKRHLRTMTAVGGAFLLTIGVLLVTNRWNEVLAPLRRLINRWTPPV
jgi:cytochrome c-type biogenesis protein